MAFGPKSTWDAGLRRIGHYFARKLNQPVSGYDPYTPSDLTTLCQTLEVGDLLLVEGGERISGAIKYLTQSTWSHAARYVGTLRPKQENDGEPHRLVEVDVPEGCISVPLSKYANHTTRICRAKGLGQTDREVVALYMLDNVGLKYDLRNIFDLFRYFLPTPPVPVRWRRRIIDRVG